MKFGDTSSNSASIASTLSWNTGSSRTRNSTLSSAPFSNPAETGVHSLGSVLQTVKALELREYSYGRIRREEKLGEGETFTVHRCELRDHNGQNLQLAIKHLKCNRSPNNSTYLRRLKSVILELRIMRHSPLRFHPNITEVFGFGWHKASADESNNRNNGLSQAQIMPYLLVPYAAYGNFRDYLRLERDKIKMKYKEILLGDIASAIESLHACGIVHGDVKLDNVLVFDSWDRPSGTLAKLADFGHSILIGKGYQQGEKDPPIYTGTLPYNAPEVRNQNTTPIPPEELHKCDIWSFGLLIWETFLHGEAYYLKYEQSDGGALDETFWPEPTALLELAKGSVGRCELNPLRAPLFRAAFTLLLQVDPSKRRSDLSKFPFMTAWHSTSFQSMQAANALHIGSSEWSYNMFRPDTGREIAWEHEVQIFSDLRSLVSKSRIRDSADANWQLALCYHLGFGVSPSPSQAYEYTKAAIGLRHPVSQQFGFTLMQNNQCRPDAPTAYAEKVKGLLQMSPNAERSMLIEIFLQANFDPLLAGLQPDITDYPPGRCGCTIWHWLFMLNENQLRHTLADLLQTRTGLDHLNSQCTKFHVAHRQWPLELSGTPLAFAIAVDNFLVVQHLLSLGASPLNPVYKEGQFPRTDPRSQWTALHMAAKYHNPKMLQTILDAIPESSVPPTVPLGCSLCYSSPLERRAMHGSHWKEKLNDIVKMIQSYQSLASAGPNGMTALSQAIDYHDLDVISALLETEPALASAPLRSPRNPDVYNFPVHFAAQLAARRDVAEATQILELINTYTGDLAPGKPPRLDSMNRTPLHLSVTGPSCGATKWLLGIQNGLLHFKDMAGRTPLQCSGSRVNSEMLLNAGASIDHADSAGMTALHMACFNGNLEIVLCLLNRKAKLNLKKNNYGTPLHCAILNGSLEMVMALLEANAPINERDCHQDTPVHIAVRMRRFVILRYLVRHGADITLRDRQHKTAGDIALGRLDRTALSILGSNHKLQNWTGFGTVREDVQQGAAEVLELESVFDREYREPQDEASNSSDGGQSDYNTSSEFLNLEQTRKRDLAELAYNLSWHFAGSFKRSRDIVEYTFNKLRSVSTEKEIMIAAVKAWTSIWLTKMVFDDKTRTEVLLGVLKIIVPIWSDGLDICGLSTKIEHYIGRDGMKNLRLRNAAIIKEARTQGLEEPDSRSIQSIVQGHIQSTVHVESSVQRLTGSTTITTHVGRVTKRISRLTQRVTGKEKVGRRRKEGV